MSLDPRIVGGNRRLGEDAHNPIALEGLQRRGQCVGRAVKMSHLIPSKEEDFEGRSSTSLLFEVPEKFGKICAPSWNAPPMEIDSPWPCLDRQPSPREWRGYSHVGK